MDSNRLGLRFNCMEEQESEVQQEREEVHYPETVMGVRLISANQVPSHPQVWLWKNFLMEGKGHLLTGDKAAGKTTLALEIAAIISRGGRWPDGTTAGAGDVIYWSCEDDISDTLKPRLEAAGANMKRIKFIQPVLDENGFRPFDPAEDFPALWVEASKLPNPKLIVVDPIITVVKGNSNLPNVVRRSTMPIADEAMRRKIAILGIHHNAKNSSDRKPLDQVLGSQAWTAVARIVLRAEKGSLEDRDQRAFFVIESNVSKYRGGFFYHLKSNDLTDESSQPSISWKEPIEGEAESILKTLHPEERESKLKDAISYLESVLSDGPIASDALLKRAIDDGFTRSTIYRAKEQLGIKPVKEGMKGGWTWSLPGRCLSNNEDTQQRVLSNFDNIWVSSDRLEKEMP